MSFSADVSKLVEHSSSSLVACARRWERISLGEVAEVLNGFPWRSEYFNRQTGVRVVRIRDVTSGRSETLYSGPVFDGYSVLDGDLLVGMDGDFNVRIWNGGLSLLNQRVCKISTSNKYHKGFLAILLPGYLDLINKATHSVTVKHLSSRTLQDLPIPLPPLGEQQRIAASVDRLSMRSKRANDELERVHILATRAKRSILEVAFTGLMTRDLRGSDALIGWRKLRLQEVADIQTGITLGKKRGAGERAIPRPYLRVANVQRGWLDLREIKHVEVTEAESERLRLLPGDILMNEGGDRDKLGRGWVWRGQIPDCVHQNHVFRVRLRDDRYPPELVSLFANEFGQSHFIDEGKQTTNLASISKAKLATLPLIFPPSDEAAEMLCRIERAFAAIDRLTAEAHSAREKLKNLNRAILAKAFRGELVPHDPDDEPAIVLLDRIRAERAAAGPARKRGRRPRAVEGA